jgi:hypothetical protein
MFNLTKLTIIAGAALFGANGASSGTAYDRDIEVVNNSHLTITSFYASNVGTDSWEDDILGNRVLPAGYRVRVNLDDGSSYCRFDLRTRFADGTIVVRRNVDVCSTAKYTLTD